MIFNNYMVFNVKYSLTLLNGLIRPKKEIRCPISKELMVHRSPKKY